MTRMLLLTVSAFVALAAHAEAGIIVLNNGQVFQGRVDTETAPAEKLRMHWPYKNFRGPLGSRAQGHKDFDQREIRWFSAESCELTSAYAKLHGKKFLVEPFATQLSVLQEIEKGKSDTDQIVSLKPEDTQGQLLPSYLRFKHFKIRKPLHWKIKKQQARGKSAELISITFDSDKVTQAPSQVLPSLQITSVPYNSKAVKATTLKTWFLDEVRRSKTLTHRSFVKIPSWNQTLLGRHQLTCESIGLNNKEQAIHAIRKLVITDGRVFVISCYALKQDFEKHRPTFEASLKSLVITKTNQKPSNALKTG